MIDHAHPAAVSSSVLQWAIERAETSTADLASALKTSESVVEKWIAGERSPSFPQARQVAKKLRVPFGFLFLREPPPDDLPIPDFRRIDGEVRDRISVDLRDVLLAALRRQSWLSESLREAGAAPIGVVGRANGERSPITVAADIRRALHLNDGTPRPTRVDDQLRDLVRRVESLGVNVLRSGVVGNNTHRPLSVVEFRGFCLSDDYAPFIFINGVDAKAAQAFTLMHELAHIWRGDSGISGAIELSGSSAESFCNRVAAEVLLPNREFVAVWDGDLPVGDAVQAAARHFRVSRFAAAIRAFESGFMSRSELDLLLAEYRADGGRATGDNTGGGDYYKTLIVRNGRLFTEGVVDAVSRQRVLIRDAANMLEAKPGQLARLAGELGSDRS